MTDDLKEKLTAAIKEAAEPHKRKTPIIAYAGLASVILIITLIAASALYSSGRTANIETIDPVPVPENIILTDLDPELPESPPTEIETQYHLGVGCSKRALMR